VNGALVPFSRDPIQVFQIILSNQFEKKCLKICHSFEIPPSEYTKKLKRDFSKNGPHSFRDHPLKTSAFFRGEGVKNWPKLPIDSSKKTAAGRGVGVKNCENLPTS
jgi:hypothetical protein